MRKVVITGAAGYIGSVLTGYFLDEGDQVTVLDSLLYDKTSLLRYVSNPMFRFIKGDVRDTQLVSKLMRDADVIIPLAALVGFPLCDERPRDAIEVNQDANLFIAKNKSRDQIVVYPCTNSGYGLSDRSKPCTEESPMNPTTLYGKTKVEAERVYKETESCSTLRLATVFGPSPRMRTDLLVNNFVLRAMRDKNIVLYEDAYKRNYIHINDVCAAFVDVVNNWVICKNQTYNVGNDNINCTKRELAEKISSIVKCDLHVTSGARDPDQRDYIVSSKKFRDAVRFECKFDLETGISQLVTAYNMIEQPWYANYA